MHPDDWNAQTQPLEEGDFYLSPEGYRVFTEQYLLKRGYCCQNGCRHCPYGFSKKKASEPPTKLR